MDEVAVVLNNQKPVRLKPHPLARAVALSLMGATLFGCAGGPLKGPEAVDHARSAYAREDYTEAAQLLAVPAMQGNADAQYALGYLYYYGKGVRKDQHRARAWFEDAARLGHSGAKQALAKLKVYGQLPLLPGEEAARASAEAEELADESTREVSDAAQSTRGTNTVPANNALWPAEAAKAADAPRATVVPAPVANVNAPLATGSGDKAAAPAASNGSVAPAVSAAPVAPAVSVTPAAPAVSATPPAVSVTPAAAQPQNAAVVPAPVQEQNAAMVNPAEQKDAGSTPSQPASAAEPAPEPEPAPASHNLHSAQAPVTRVRAGVTGAQSDASNAPAPGMMKTAWREKQPPQSTHAPALQHTALANASVPAAPSQHETGNEAPGQNEASGAAPQPRYTLHLLSSRRKADLIRLVKTHGLDQAGYYIVKQNGTNYRLVYGGFQTVAEARVVLKTLPPALYVHRPWVNNYPADSVVLRF